jgi:hypothetical protein
MRSGRYDGSNRNYFFPRIKLEQRLLQKALRIIYLTKDRSRPYLHEGVRGTRAMTIAIGVRCDEGNLLLADRQITKAGGLKYYEKKIREVSGGLPQGFFNVSFAYAGFPDAAKFIVAEVEQRISRLKIADININSLHDCVEESLANWWKKHRQQGDVELLISLFVWGQESKLYRSKGKLLHASDFDCLGIGDSSIVRYFTETFVNERMGLHQLLPLFIYVMEQAKKYIDGCGGQTDVLYTVKGRSVGRTSATRIQSDNEKIEQHMQGLFNIFFDPGKSDAALAENLEYVRKRAFALRSRLESRLVLRDYPPLSGQFLKG